MVFTRQFSIQSEWTETHQKDIRKFCNFLLSRWRGSQQKILFGCQINPKLLPPTVRRFLAEFGHFKAENGQSFDLVKQRTGLLNLKQQLVVKLEQIFFEINKRQIIGLTLNVLRMKLKLPYAILQFNARVEKKIYFAFLYEDGVSY